MGSSDRRTPCQTVRADFRHTAYRWSSESGLRRIVHRTAQAIEAQGVEPGLGPTPCTETPTLAPPTPQPAPDALMHVVVKVVELIVRVSRRKVFAPTTQHRVERRDDVHHLARRVAAHRRQLVDAVAHSLDRTRRRPALHVVLIGPALDAAALAHRAAEEVKAFPPPSQIDRSRLLRMQLKTESSEDILHPLVGHTRRPGRSAPHNKVVGS